MFDAAMLPKINYVSMLLDRDSDTSADADALAMKYLTDEQLSELAKLRLSQSSARHKRDIGLDRIMAANTSQYATPANQMSFASKKYLERYGLLEDSVSQTPLCQLLGKKQQAESGSGDGIATAVTPPLTTDMTKGSIMPDRVLDIERLRELPKLL